jgi:hypothetical protein
MKMSVSSGRDILKAECKKLFYFSAIYIFALSERERERRALQEISKIARDDGCALSAQNCIRRKHMEIFITLFSYMVPLNMKELVQVNLQIPSDFNNVIPDSVFHM